MSESPVIYGYIGFPGLLTLIFITLKLTHVIDWAWLWVLSPMLIIAGLVAIVLAMYGVSMLIFRFFIK